MMSRPAFHPYFTVHALGDEGVVLLSERGAQLLKGRLYGLVGPWLDGKHSVDDITAALERDCSAAEVYYTLDRLEQKGYLVEGGASPEAPFNPERAAFWKAHGLDHGTSEDRLRAMTVSVRAVGGADAGPCILALEETGLRIDPAGDVEVVLTDDYLRPELAAVNREALAADRPWFLAKTVGAELWLGPVFRPGRTGCWECLAHRLRANRELASYLEQRLRLDEPIVVSRGALPSSHGVGRQLIATEVAKWVAAGDSTALEGKLLTLDTRTWRSEEHILTRRPQCRACGDPRPTSPSQDAEVRPLRLQSRKKAFIADGGHRAADPAETLEVYGRHVSPITGVVNVLERPEGVRRKDPVIHLYLSGHNVAVRRCAFDEFRRHFRSFSGGKGMTEAEAKVGALAEAIERYSGVFQPDSDPRRWARYVDLGPDAIHPYAYLLFSEKQYRERDVWNAARSRFNWVPEPFDEEAVVAWTPVWSLTAGKPKYVPTMSCYFSYRPGPGEPRFSPACSNGNAAGNTLEEAIVQGFLELVERDAVAIWWYNRLRKAAVDLESFNEPYFPRLRDRYRELGRELWVLDITSDLGVPAFAAVSRRLPGGRARGGEEIVFGFGAHFDARLGVARALTEMNQMTSVLSLAASRNGSSGAGFIDDPETLRWIQSATLEEQSYLAPREGVPLKQAADYLAFESDDLLDDVTRCRELVEGIGLEMLVLDLTRPDIGMPTVKVMVPGLRHFWARFAPGRLYDVPVASGDLPRPLREEELNPIPVFI